MAYEPQKLVFTVSGDCRDITGARAWRIHHAVVIAACNEAPRAGYPEEARRQWKAECHAFPNGRAAFARRPGCLIAASYLAPLPRNAAVKEPA